MRSREDVQGWYMPQEGARLVELARTTPGLVVELGTAWGKSIAYVLDATDKDVVCIDLWSEEPVTIGDYEVLYDDGTYFRELVEAEGWATRVEMIRGNTQEIARTWTRPIGLLHIDAGHDYDSVRADYIAWSPFVVPGGAIALHDMHTGGVTRVLNELVVPDDRWIDRQQIYVQWSARRAS